MENKNKKERLGKILKASIIGTFSFPLAGAYIGGKNWWFPGLIFGTLATTFISMKTLDYQQRTLDEYTTGKSTIRHSYQLLPANAPLRDPSVMEKLEMFLIVTSTNTPLIKMLQNPANNKVTEVIIEGKNKGNEVSCTYKMESFVSPEDITIRGLTPLKYSINSQTGESHKSLCEQIFKEERKYF